jgi:glycosyltransferase involved in cell wall biosynthesis
MRRIRVLTLVDRISGGGGGERVAVNITMHLDAARFDRTLCVTRPSAPALLDEARAAGVRVIELNRRRQLDITAWRPLVRHRRTLGIDILHSHKFGSNVWSAVGARLLSIPILVTHEHSWSFAGDRRRVLLDRYLVAGRAAAMIAVSEADARRMAEIERIPASKIRVIPNGIEAPAVADPLKLRHELGLGDDVPIVGFVGSLRPEKRADVIIEAARGLKDAGRKFRLVLVGSGPEERALQRQAASAGVDDVVCFLGYRSDATDLAAGFDVAVLASDREGAPLSLLEYMSLGRAIVATRVGGVPDIVVDGRHACLVGPGNAAELQAAIGRLLDDPAERDRLGRAAAARQAEAFDLVTTTRQIEGLYLELIAARYPPTAPRSADVRA